MDAGMKPGDYIITDAQYLWRIVETEDGLGLVDPLCVEDRRKIVNQDPRYLDPKNTRHFSCLKAAMAYARIMGVDLR